MNEIRVELFRFDSKTDYLPYYTKHRLVYSEEDTVNDLLAKINETDPFGYRVNGNLKFNELYINAKENVAKMVARCGDEVQINPMSEFRAQKDLIIDRSDFIQKMSLIERYLGAEEIIAYRKSAELVYYASNTLNYNKDYIGDHVLLIAADLIEKDFSLRNEIISLLCNDENGLWYHTSIANRVLDKTHEAKIQKVIYLALESTKPRSKIAKKLAGFCSKNSIKDFETSTTASASSIAQSFDGFNIAAYHGVGQSQLKELVSASQASYIQIPSEREDLGSHSVLADEKFSFMIAGDILMQAKDNNADFVLVKNETTKVFFDANQKKMEKLTGRELGMSIVSQEQFVQLLQGEKDSTKLGFNEHKVTVSFL
jgi:succinate dehydrogenase/fumarate reductase-like Fe-S protein